MADTAVVGERVGFGPPWAARILAALSECLAAEGERRLLWLPVFFGAGIGLYYALKDEPPLWPGVVAAIAGAGLSFALRRHPAWCEAAPVEQRRPEVTSCGSLCRPRARRRDRSRSSSVSDRGPAR